MLLNDARALENENEKLKEIIKELMQEIGKTEEKPMACKCCQYYVQHYGKFRDGFREVNSGHCTRGKVKSRKPDASCEYFEIGRRLG